MPIIELSSGLNKFYLTLVKLYYNLIIETDKNIDKNIINTSLEMYDNLKYKKVLTIYFFLNIFPTLVSLILLIFSTIIPIISSTF